MEHFGVFRGHLGILIAILVYFMAIWYFMAIVVYFSHFSLYSFTEHNNKEKVMKIAKYQFLCNPANPGWDLNPRFNSLTIPMPQLQRRNNASITAPFIIVSLDSFFRQ
jgi:hypothetical protein